jgi:hypothetical protein
MRISVKLSVLIVAVPAQSAPAADRITYAIGGPAQRSVDTLAHAPKHLKEVRLPILKGETAERVEKRCPETELAEIGSGEPFLSEPAPRETLFVMPLPPEDAHVLPRGIEAPPTGSPFDGMPLAAR